MEYLVVGILIGWIFYYVGEYFKKIKK